MQLTDNIIINDYVFNHSKYRTKKCFLDGHTYELCGVVNDGDTILGGIYDSETDKITAYFIVQEGVMLTAEQFSDVCSEVDNLTGKGAIIHGRIGYEQCPEDSVYMCQGIYYRKVGNLINQKKEVMAYVYEDTVSWTTVHAVLDGVHPTLCEIGEMCYVASEETGKECYYSLWECDRNATPIDWDDGVLGI